MQNVKTEIAMVVTDFEMMNCKDSSFHYYFIQRRTQLPTLTSCIFIATDIALPFPITNMLGTESQLVSAWIVEGLGTTFMCAKTVFLMLIVPLPTEKS